VPERGEELAGVAEVLPDGGEQRRAAALALDQEPVDAGTNLFD
jgi:hypothetical protein